MPAAKRTKNSKKVGDHIAAIKDFDTKGTKVSIKFFLNKKLNAAIVGHEKLYPVYARVICKKQVCDFRIPTEPFSQADLDAALNSTSVDGKEISNFRSIENDIELILQLVQPFKRDNFKLANLPKILRLKDDYVVRYKSDVIVKQMKTNLAKNGYSELADIIDWSMDLKSVTENLIQLQKTKAIRKFELLTLGHHTTFLSALYIIADLNVRPHVTAAEKLLERLERQQPVRPDAGTRNASLRALQYAFEFIEKAVEMSS